MIMDLWYCLIMSKQFVLMVERMVERVSNMRPIPPCDDLFDASWSKVDKLVLKSMKAMKERGVERPLHPLSEALVDMAVRDFVENKETSPGLQALAYRVMDIRLLVDEFMRMKGIAGAIHGVAKGRKGAKEPDEQFFRPDSPAVIPPCFANESWDVYDDSAIGIVNRFREVLVSRGILPAKRDDD